MTYNAKKPRPYLGNKDRFERIKLVLKPRAFSLVILVFELQEERLSECTNGSKSTKNFNAEGIQHGGETRRAKDPTEELGRRRKK